MQDFRVKSGLRVSGNVYGVDYLTANNINVTYNGIFGNLTVNGSIVGNVTGTVSSLSNQTTSNLAEGTNQYFTNARAYANLTAASINACRYNYLASKLGIRINLEWYSLGT